MAEQQELPLKKARVVHIRCTPAMKRVVEQAVALRTSALCRDADDNLIFPSEIDSDELDDIPEDSVAIVAILHSWIKTFTTEKLAALRNGHE